MSSAELTAITSAISIAIANSVPENDQLGLLAAIITQIGDTLTTIVAQRNLCDET